MAYKYIDANHAGVLAVHVFLTKGNLAAEEYVG